MSYIEKCPRCGKKKLEYEKTVTLGDLSYQYFTCKKCNAFIQADRYGNVWAVDIPR